MKVFVVMAETWGVIHALSVHESVITAEAAVEAIRREMEDSYDNVWFTAVDYIPFETSLTSGVMI